MPVARSRCDFLQNDLSPWLIDRYDEMVEEVGPSENKLSRHNLNKRGISVRTDDIGRIDVRDDQPLAAFSELRDTFHHLVQPR